MNYNDIIVNIKINKITEYKKWPKNCINQKNLFFFTLRTKN